MIEKVKAYLKTKSHFFRTFFLFLCALIIYFIFKILSYTYITIEYTRLRPFKGYPPVIYNGFKIGRCISIKPDKFYTKTHMTVVLFPKDLNLPQNTYAQFRQIKINDKNLDFVELIYPTSPAIKRLKTKNVIQGVSMIPMEDFFQNQDPNALKNIQKDLSKTIKDLDNTILALGDLFQTMETLIEKNQNNLYQTTTNFNRASNNINQITSKINYAINQNELQSIFSEINASFGNIKSTTQNLSVLTGSVDKMIPTTINTQVMQIDNIMDNVNDITCGIKNTLSKNFGGLRILFGKTINENNNCECEK